MSSLIRVEFESGYSRVVFVVMEMFKRSSAQHSTPHVSAAARQSCGVVKPEHAALR
jgi:hypothetical protein